MDLSSLSELQLAVMQSLWCLGSSSVADVQGALNAEGRPLATTTVATVLQRLEKQGWVRHKKRGRLFLYTAAVSEKVAAKSALWRVVDGFFGGSVANVAAHLVDSRQVSDAELEAMRELLDRKRK